MTRSIPSLALRRALSSLTGAMLALLALSAPVEAQVLYDTAAYKGATPGSTAAAIATFDGLDASTTGYGCAAVSTVDALNNQSQFAGGSPSNLAYHEAAVFDVAPSQAGLWSFRWGGDFGFGGTLLLDGVELDSHWYSMWWNGEFTDPGQSLTGSANLRAGTHIVEIFGFEDCCDGAGNAQFLPQMSATWLDISTTNLTLAPAVCGSPALLLTGSASPSPVLPGSQLTFTLFYESTGELTAANAALSTAIPAGTTFVSATGGGVFSNGAVNWALGPLGVGVSGTVTFTVQVDSTLADGTAISNVASLSATGATTAKATTTVTASSAVLTLGSVSTPNPVAAGGPLTITLNYANTGIGVGGTATIVDSLPAYTTFVSASSSGAYDATSNRVKWDLGALAMNASGSVSFIVNVATPLANGTVLSDLATLSATGSAAAATATSSATVRSAPSLTLTNAAEPNPVRAGAQLSYTLMFANQGTDAAHQVTVTDTLPANVSFISASSGGSYDGTNTVTWSLDDLRGGISGAFTVLVLVKSGATGSVLTDTATLTAMNNATPIVATAMTTVSSADAGTSDAATGGTGTGGHGGLGGGGGAHTGSAGVGGGGVTGNGGAGGKSTDGGTSIDGATSTDGGTTTDGSVAGSGGAGGNKGAAGAGGNAGMAGSSGGTTGSSGCNCTVGAAPSPTSLLGLGAVLGLLLASRRKRRR